VPFVTELVPPFAISVAIAVSVSCVPFNVVCTAVSCDGVNVESETIEASNWVSVAASALNVVLTALICVAESPVVAVTAVAFCVPVSTLGAETALGVPASADATMPFCISKLINVACAT
jgi:hypothetical protein